MRRLSAQWFTGKSESRRHVLLIFIAVLGLYAQFAYRVPGHLLIVLLPWIGLGLASLHVLFLFRAFLRTSEGRESFWKLVRFIERSSTAMILVFGAYSLFITLNANFDSSIPKDEATDILEIGGAEIDFGGIRPISWADLRSWRSPGGTERVLLREAERQRLWGGQAVLVRLRRGFFHVPWIFRIEGDAEKQNLAVLKLAPTATLAWKKLTYFYLSRLRWAEATAASLEYLRILPHDDNFAVHVAGQLNNAKQYRDIVTMLEPVAARRPNYNVYSVLGFSLSKVGRRAEAIEMLKTAISLEPDNYWAYYVLGYVYVEAREVDEAVRMFKKVLEIQPGYPEVEDMLRRLRPMISKEKSSGG